MAARTATVWGRGRGGSAGSTYSFRRRAFGVGWGCSPSFPPAHATNTIVASGATMMAAGAMLRCIWKAIANMAMIAKAQPQRLPHHRQHHRQHSRQGDDHQGHRRAVVPHIRQRWRAEFAGQGP